MGDESPDRTAQSDVGDQVAAVMMPIAYRRERLMAAMALMLGIGLMLALPFALQAGAPFFLPVTAAMVIAIALVPLLEWLERRGVPSQLAALICVLTFLIGANIAIASIIVPATDWLALLPERISRVRNNLGPILDIYSTLERFINDTVSAIQRTSVRPSRR
jgi:predicted PurR-regulated permease PerM